LPSFPARTSPADKEFEVCISQSKEKSFLRTVSVFGQKEKMDGKKKTMLRAALILALTACTAAFSSPALSQVMRLLNSRKPFTTRVRASGIFCVLYDFSDCYSEPSSAFSNS